MQRYPRQTRVLYVKKYEPSLLNQHPHLVQELLGHKNVATTQKHIGVSCASAREAVEAIALAAQPYRSHILSDLLGEIRDEHS